MDFFQNLSVVWLCDGLENTDSQHDLPFSSAAKERKPSVSDQKPLYKHTPFGLGSKPITHSLSQPGHGLKHKYSICICKAMLQIQTSNNPGSLPSLLK